MKTEVVQVFRKTIATWAQAPDHDATSEVQVAEVYSPARHQNALDPDRTLVVGSRGAGKSFWTATLLNEQARGYVARSYPRPGLDRCSVALGFGGVENSATAPAPQTLDMLEKEGWAGDTIWRATVLRALAAQMGLSNVPKNLAGPEGLVAWVSENPERAVQMFTEVDSTLVQQRRQFMVLFDALDRVGPDWAAIHRRTRDLLRVALSMRSYRSIRVKIFMRTDQAEDRSVTGFPDASKLVNNAARLDWSMTDLYGLLYHRLANDPVLSTHFHQLVLSSTLLELSGDMPVQLPTNLKEEEAEQETVFVELAGRYMGKEKRKGRTYNWLFNHLADARREVSPRSFLAAVQNAAEYSQSADTPLHYRGLQEGIKHASEVRLTQLRDDYLWIEKVLEPLADQSVPCPDEALYVRWEAAGTLQDIERATKGGSYLPPIEWEGREPDFKSMVQALIRIGVAERRPDGRVNVPDIYRVAARLLRKGGVPPKR